MQNQRVISFFTVIVMYGAGSVPLAASVPLIGIHPGLEANFDEPHKNGAWGWTFYVTSPITITPVGWYDQNGDGLSHPHQIGLWKDLSGKTSWPYLKTNSSGQAVVDAQQLLGTFPPGITIPAGVSAELDGP